MPRTSAKRKSKSEAGRQNILKRWKKCDDTHQPPSQEGVKEFTAYTPRKAVKKSKKKSKTTPGPDYQPGNFQTNCPGNNEVKWGDEDEVFPYVWLRDNCRCPACFHAASYSRLSLMADMDLQVQPKSAEILSGGKQVEVVWRDGHRSEYEAEWLRLRGFSEATRRARASRFRLERKYWGSELMDNLPEASFQEVMEDDAALLEWLRRLEVFGFVKVNGAPAEQGQVRRLAERIGFIRKTHYGEEFTVKVKPSPSNLAYHSGPLELHADLPFYEYQPGVQFLHCIVQHQGEGG
ncbi:gamma-butyrobetaine dioxygenase-like, partial [Eriocheir sinensis]|uniref:gamma-butyrobetaine dioxygenase-like n=1 Tax=Eriocheir sinensis TaxID=95602 RepID=UPI0021C73092